MRARIFGGFLLLALGAGACESGYDNSDLELVVAYRAKSVCSCLWVMERDLDYCVAWTAAFPDVAKLSVDQKNRKITATALWFWSAEARWIDGQHGCALSEE